MKRSQIILFALLLGISGLIYSVLLLNKKEVSKEIKSEQTLRYLPVRKVANTMREMQLSAYGQVNPNTELSISFEVQGKLQQGETRLKPGVKFSKGQLLYRVDNEEAFYQLSARKSSLATMLINAMPDIELDFPSEVSKWNQFLNELLPSKILPELPPIRSSRERLFLTSRNFLSEYYNVRSLEARMDKYLYAAPFSGVVLQVFSEPGAVVGPGVQVAKIARVGDFEVKVPVDLDELEFYKNEHKATFINSAGEKIGEGNLLRMNEVVNQLTQSADLYYSIHGTTNHGIYHGLFVNVTIKQQTIKESMPLPRNAVRDQMVSILSQGKLERRAIKIVGSKPDTVFVTGLNNDEVVVLEHIDEQPKGISYKGIIK